ncbi:hypothetical protein [Phoenicibacter congonensis]|uniref:hypothetical protein n=1 Tax=Phoenicibacter congonensis TaxID=1944646 RepID=UPI0012FF6262|nr:hypothetical protein [Phoenicibacter congonensis]
MSNMVGTVDIFSSIENHIEQICGKPLCTYRVGTIVMLAPLLQLQYEDFKQRRIMAGTF